MSIPYRTRRVLNRLGLVLMIFLLVGVIAWLCWVVWLERYVVYTADGASLDFEHSSQDIIGEVATPPVAQQKISIYYNEGSDALDTGNELTQINGYYISSNMLQNDINGVLGKLERLPAGTPVMIDMKGPYGSFFYPSHLDGAVHSASTDVNAVAALVDTLMNKKFYTIARVCSLRTGISATNTSPAVCICSPGQVCGWIRRAISGWIPPTPPPSAGSPPWFWS